MIRIHTNSRRLVVGTLTVAALVVSLVGCSGGGTTVQPAPSASSAAQPSKAAAPAGPELGTPFEVKQNDGTAKITIASATYGPSDGNTSFSIPAKNGGYLILDVLWETAEGTSQSNPLYFKVKDASGHEGSIAVTIPDSLGSGDVPVGDKSAGNVGFDIGAGPYTVVVTDQLLQEKARLTVTATPVQ